jgi:hypothetical protein
MRALERFDAARAAISPPPFNIPTVPDTRRKAEPATPPPPESTIYATRHKPAKATAPQPAAPKPTAPKTSVQRPTPPVAGPSTDRRVQQPPPDPPTRAPVLKPRKVEVVVPPSPKKTFQQIEASGDASGDEYHPPPSPGQSAPAAIQHLQVYVKGCERCQKGRRDCVVEHLGAACVDCRLRKYRCDHTSKRDAQTMWVTRPIADLDLEIEVVEDKPKGTKRSAESLADPNPDNGKGKTKATSKKSKGKGRQTKNSSATVVESEPEEMEVQIESEEEAKPKPKRLRLVSRKFNNIIRIPIDIFFVLDYTEHAERIAVLESKMQDLNKVAEETTRTTIRMDAMEGQVNRFAGALETFLSRVSIDHRYRLVPEPRRIDDIQTPAPHTTPRSASPPLLAMDEDDVGSSLPDIRTTPSDFDAEIRMPDAAIVAESAESFPCHTAVAPPEPVAVSESVPAPMVIDTAPAPTFNVVPATPQGSQDAVMPKPAPHVPPPTSSPMPNTAAEVESIPLPPARAAQSRSRTPAAALLGVPEGRTTRSRSRSKTPL